MERDTLGNPVTRPTVAIQMRTGVRFEGRSLTPYSTYTDLPPEFAAALITSGRAVQVRIDPVILVPPPPKSPDLAELSRAELEALADERQVQVVGTGARGRVLVEDLILALSAPPEPEEADDLEDDEDLEDEDFDDDEDLEDDLDEEDED